MEKFGCEIICGASTTLAVEGYMMMIVDIYYLAHLANPIDSWYLRLLVDFSLYIAYFVDFYPNTYC